MSIISSSTGDTKLGIHDIRDFPLYMYEIVHVHIWSQYFFVVCILLCNCIHVQLLQAFSTTYMHIHNTGVLG